LGSNCNQSRNPRRDGWSSGLQSGTFRENYAQFMADHGLAVDYGVRRLDGGGSLWVCICDVFPDQAIATSTGAFLGITDGMWHNKSDRASKTAFELIDSRAILDKVAALPIGSFQFIDDPAHARHIGPTAQDFHSTFSLGTSHTSIGTGDSEGVALAAIQGLHQLVQERDAQINAQRLELLTLKERLVQLESLRDELNVVKRTLSQLAVGNALVAVRSTP